MFVISALLLVASCPLVAPTSITDDPSEVFEGYWSGQLTCPPQNGDLEMSITSLCTRDSWMRPAKFKCIATDCSVVKGELPYGFSEVDLEKFSRRNPSFYIASGYKNKIVDLRNGYQSFDYNPDDKSFDFDHVNFTLFGPCSGRWEKVFPRAEETDDGDVGYGSLSIRRDVTTDAPSGYFVGTWSIEARCRNFEALMTSSCTRAPDQKFKCTGVDFNVVKGEMPDGISEAEFRQIWNVKPFFFRVNGNKIEDLYTHQTTDFHPDDGSIDIPEHKLPLLGLCTRRYIKQG